MIVHKLLWTRPTGWRTMRGEGTPITPQLILLFGARAALQESDALATLRTQYPGARLVGCSTAGEICGTDVSDDAIVAAVVQFEHTQIRVMHLPLTSMDESHRVGAELAGALRADDLVHVLVLSEGLQVNGSELLAGLREQLPAHVLVTGGLAADGAQFEKTSVCIDGGCAGHAVAAIGLYGDRLQVGHGSLGGWDAFGPERVITRSKGNVLYELDGAPALELYKSYLGRHAGDLPSSGLLFPLSVRGAANEKGVVRTILGIDEAAGSLTFAGDVPQGHLAQLMKANVDRLVDGAQGAASASLEALGSTPPELAILISCVGRKLVLKQRVEEEVESVRDVLGDDAVLVGFYSYGEIAPFSGSTACELHNQTMTITTLRER
ncbi:MAG: FIST N-terminal domain-containing protein [Gemmatimonadota bacterium]|nr:FIST N-terminal domain-containing protein [Gemmatimonadota bacterium]